MAKTMKPIENLESVNDYLDTKHHVNLDITENINDFGKVVISPGYDFTTREIICSLLAGKGLKLPNIQICLSVNLKRLVNLDPDIGKIQPELQSEIEKLDNTFDRFIDHTKIDNVLGRINDSLSEITNIANMINFCGKPITPIAIPNTLENAMQSFLGRGEGLATNIGSIIPSKLGGCLGTNDLFNRDIFDGGILGDISNNWERVINQELTPEEIEDYTTRINEIVDDIDNLIEEENNTNSVVDLGGSEFGQRGPINTKIGVIHNPEAAGIQGNTRIASLLKNSYDQLAGYPVIDSDGNVYDNIFELFVDESLLDLLRNPVSPSPEISEQQPVYNYCGEIVGYTKVVTQEEQNKSLGDEPSSDNINDPGNNTSAISTTEETSISTLDRVLETLNNVNKRLDNLENRLNDIENQ